MLICTLVYATFPGAFQYGCTHPRTSSLCVHVVIRAPPLLFPPRAVCVCQGPPNFPQATYSATINQNAVAGDVIITVACTPPETAAIDYAIISSDPAEIASVNASTGVVSLIVDAINLSGNFTVSLRCGVDGEAAFGTALLEIARVEANEHAPQFTVGSNVVNISESRDIETDSFVAQFTATDEDLGTFGTVIYSLHGLQSEGFAIDPQTGRITLTASLNYETNHVHLFLVHASNPATDAGEVLFNATTLEVRVLDINDELPLFINESYSAIVQETTDDTPRPSPGFLVVACTDLDSSDSNITYAALADSGPFVMDRVTGSFSLTEDLDYETTTSYSFMIGCWDNSTPNLTSSADVNILVGSVNEYRPQIDSNPTVPTIDEGDPTGTIIINVTATDGDAGPDGVVTYTLTSQDSQSIDINLTTGSVYVSAPEELDFESLELTSEEATFFRYAFSVTACNVHPPTLDCETASYTLFIFGVNEDPPEFTQERYMVPYPEENTPVGTTVTTAACSDSDRGTGRFCSIAFDETVGSDVTDTFIIDEHTGEIITRGRLDYETQTKYGFGLVCHDAGDGGACDGEEEGVMSARTTVEVNVEPINDNQPFFTQSAFEFNVSRTTPADRRTVGVASASDADVGEGGNLEFTLETNGFFDITDDGQVQIFNSVSNYSESFLSMTVEVSDSVDIDTALVVVHLTEGNHNRPVFLSGPRVIEVSELSPIDTSVVSLSCEDADSGVNGDIRYSITDGNSNTAFKVDQITGEISVRNILVLPQNTTSENYILTITCEDRGVPVFSDQASVFIRVYQDDSQPPSFENDTIVAFISEDAELSDHVVTVEAVDLDSEQLAYRFELDPSQPTVFTIGISTGEVIVAAPLNREVTSVYTMTVVATEQRQTPGPERSDNATLIIYIRDVNDNTPTCHPGSPTAFIQETLEVGSTVLQLNCSDPDVAENGAIGYSLSNDFNGVLAIDNMGEIKLNKSLSETEQNTLVVDILLADMGSDPNELTVRATIFIFSVNRHIPEFTNLPATIEVSESQAIQTVFFSVMAEDPDRGSFGDVTYSIVDSTTSDDVGIFSNTGGIFLNRKLNFFHRNEYSLNVSAADSDFTVYEQLTIHVLDANEFSPECEQQSITYEIREGLPTGQVLTPALSCYDDDIGSNGDLMFDIVTGNSDNAFEIDSNGTLMTLQVLDFDAGTQRYELTVNVSDSGVPARSLDVRIIVVVEAVNEFSPVIQGGPYSASVTENSRIGLSVLQLTVRDDDSADHAHSRLEYEIAGLTDPSFQFTSSGELQVAGDINREDESSYNFTVTVSDQGNPPLSDDTVVMVTVTDLDDNAPEFTEDLYVAVLNGTAADRGTSVVTVECTDDDEGSNAVIEYSLIPGGGDTQFFSIDANGVIRVEDNLPVSDLYSILVTCIGPQPQNFSDTTVVSIQVLVNSNITFTPSSSQTISVPETTGSGTELLTIEATSSTGAQLFFDLVDAASPFTIDETTGVLQLRGELDYELTQTYTILIRASDDGSPPNFGDAVIQVLVVNVNDEIPVILTQPSTITIVEGAGLNLPLMIAMYECTDNDDGEFGDVQFSILSGNADNLFSISLSGTLQLLSSLDYELAQFHSLQLVCQDGGQPPNTDTITVPITVTPINDNPPVFPSDTLEIFVTEDLPSGSNIGAPIEASDADLPPHGNLRYSLINGNDPRVFAVSSETGQLSLVQTLDYETTISYSLMILAQDSGGQVQPDWPVLNDTITVLVTVLDYNDNSPHFDHTTYSGTISETAQNGDQVELDQEISCSDLDSGENGQISLAILEDSPFTVEPSGLILVSDSEQLDFETQQLYILTIACLDGGTPQLMTSVNLVVTVQDINEFGPEFSNSSYLFTVPESTMIGQRIGEVFASDLDAGEAGAISYAIITPDVPFDINPETGMMALAQSLDYETQQTSYIMQVEASDASLLSDTATVIVTVENEDDNEPAFTQAVYYLEIRENAAIDTSVGDVSCTDKDDSADDVPVSYVLDTTMVPFTLDDNGRLTVTDGLNLELTPRYTFRVNCTDSAMNTVQATVTVNILPFNDHIPVFQGNPPFSTLLAENPPLGTTVFDIDALDDDQASYNEITYSISGGNEAGRFAIDPDSGIVTTTETIDREVQSMYVLDVVAGNDIPEDDDSGSPSLSATTSLTIIITDINDNTPSLTPSNITVILQVSVSAGVTVVDLDCSDRDTGENGQTQFSITSEQFAERFEISEDGVLTTTNTIEEDVVVVVSCTDNGTPRRSSSVRVVIETVSMNEHDPVFPGPTTRTIEVREDVGVGEEVVCYTAMDADGQNSPDGTLVYSLTTQSTDTRFSVHRNTGCVFVTLTLDYDETNFYTYTLTAEDMGDPPRSANITLHITILDTIRDPPVVQGTYTRTIPETLGGGTHIVDFLCVDSDDQDMVYYAIIGGNTDGLFVIDMELGRIDVAPGQVLDYESSTSHTLLVQCTDTYNLTDSASVYVTLTPVNEYTPSFQAARYSVPEHSIGGTVVATLRWEDLDGGRDGEVDFEILSGDPRGLFEVTPGGKLLVRGSLDRETQDEFNLELSITDLSDTEPRSSGNNVTVILTDINDHRPQFDREVYNFGPLQGVEGGGHLVGVVYCSDSDIGSNGETNYDISSTSSDARLFSINSTGHVTLQGNLTDREFDNITFFIQCTDSGPIPMFGTVLVVVPVQEENFHPPVFSPSLYSTVIPEDTPIISEILLTVSASDRDRGVNGRVRYSLQNDFDNTIFIDDMSGELSLLRPLNYEVTTFYSLVAVATDGTPDSVVRLSDLADITVNVTGVNEFSPYCPDPIYVTIINKTTTGTIVDLGCLDDDAGNDGELDYIITSGNQGSLFALSPRGVLSVPTAIEPNDDMEQYSLNINVSDRGTPQRVTAVEVIAIYSFDNLDTPDFNQSQYFITVSESTEVGVVVATVTAVDDDPSLQGEVEYSLEEGGMVEFRVDSETGQLFLSSPLDYEEATELMFTVIARDRDPHRPLTGSATVYVSVTNENDNSPRCTRELYSVTVLSTAEVGQTVLTLNCSDADGDPITYSSMTSLPNLIVDMTTGEVRINGPLVPGTTAVIDISVTDGMRSIEVSVSVGVRFSNTAPPVFTHNHFNYTISEDAPLLARVGSLAASDEDSSHITFSATNTDLTEFYVSPESGDLLLTTPLDYEATTVYRFEVTVADDGSHDGTNRLTDTATVTVTVENTNDNSPQFSNGGIYGVIVSKSTAVGTDVLDISCTDRDARPFGSPIITSQDLSSSNIPFSLVQQGTDYSVQLTKQLLDSVSASYVVNITCTDGGGESVEGQVFIFVPEPDAPTFSETIYEWLLSENTATGAEFDDVMATSSDMSDVLYDIADGNPDDVFYIEPTTGVVSLVSTLDYEIQQTHGLIVRARDGQDRESRVLLLVKVLDVNDQVPLTPPSARLEVTQNSPVGTPIGTLECSDGETEETAFNFTFIPASDLFSVDQFGVVRLEGDLDATPVYVLPVTCSELDMPEPASTGVVTVEVVFVNEDTPEFEFSSYVFSISEDVATLTYVGTVEASDVDVGSFGEISYAITTGNPDQFFIEASSGRIGVLTSLDREMTESYNLTITAVDGGPTALQSTRNTGTTEVVIMVEDANDITPTPELSSYIETITTDHAVHSPVVSVICSDGDQGDAGSIVYSLAPNTVPFSVQSNGTIILDLPQPDQTVHTFDVVCSDRGTPALSSTALVTVIVTVVELEAPVFDSSSYNVTVSESEPIQTTILSVHASPSDPSVDIVYQLQSGNDGERFQVDPSSGDILIRNPLDASQQQYYTLTLRATNAGRNPLSSFTTVNVFVTDINDHSPVFSAPFYTATINESTETTTPLLTPVVQVYCTDRDITADITYSISGGPGEFNITRGGLVVTSGEIDYERETVYNLVVVCSDGGPAPQSTEATVRVEINPINEFLPRFSQESYEFSAEENSFGAEIGTLRASDGDAGSQGQITYLLQDPGNFSVVFVEPATGKVLVSNNLDYELRSFWNLTVIARDGAGDETFVPLLVSVINVNDVLPEVSPATSVAIIPHDTAPGYPVQTYTCLDGDLSPTSLSIRTGNELGYFTLTVHNQLVWTGLSDDLLTSIVLSLSIECRDVESNESTIAYTAVTVQVGDILPPKFSSERYEMDVSEDSVVGTSILNVSTVSAGHDVEYSLSELFTTLPFEVDTVTGVVSLTALLDRENSSSYVFPLHARDVVTEAVGVALVAVTVTDVNDNVPVIRPDEQVITLPESMATGLPFTAFQCSDIDEGENGTTEFSLTPLDAPFSINQGGQLAISSPLNFEEKSQYIITVVCSDQATPPETANATVVIEVTGTNEHRPMFSSEHYVFNISEAAVLGTLVGVVSAYDDDSSMTDQLEFRIVGGSGTPHFSVNSLGEIRATSLPTNATINSILDLVLEVSDGQLSSSGVVTVNIADINEPPQFPSTGILALWYTSGPVGGSITEVVCYDPDTGSNAVVALTLDSNPSSLPLSLQTLGSEGVIVGDVVAMGTISAGVYTLSLLCSDGRLNTTADITLRVEGVNMPPEFDHGDLSFSLSELTSVGTPLVGVAAGDPEGTDVTYSITSGTGLGTFNIDDITGLVTLALPLDYEITREYQFTVTATDSSRFDPASNRINVYVYVQNVNDVSPVLSPAGTSILTLLEDSTPLTHVISYQCVDPEGTQTTLSLSPSFHVINSPFSISNSAVILQTEVDYERETEYLLTVTCTDVAFTGSDQTLQQHSTLNIHITPVNIHPPQFISPPEFEVAEDVVVGREVGRVNAIDADNRVGTVITYTLLTHLDTFLIGSESGVITLRQELDYESRTNYTLSVQASDGDLTEDSVTPRTTTTEVIIHVLDINDNSPKCVQYLINIVISTGIYDDHFLAQLLCSDIDSSVNGLLAYSFIDSTLPTFENGFLLLDPGTGELRVSGILTRVQTVVVDVNVSDSGTPRREARVTLTIQIQTNSLTEPRFNISTFNTTIDENTPVDTIVFPGSTLLSALYNPNNDPVFFQLRPNEAHGRVFIINSVTGDVSLTGESPLDYDEGLQVYNLIVEVIVGASSPTAVVSIFLADVNDNPPRFSLAAYLGTVLENQPPGTLVATVTAEDIDSGVNGVFSYSIAGSINFQVHSESGEVRTRRRLDREALPTDSVTVTALDSGDPPLSSTTIVSVTIGDENDVPPRFLQDLYIININNVSPPGTQLLTLTVADADIVGEFAFRIIVNDSDSEVRDLFTVLTPRGVLAQTSLGIPSDHRLVYRFGVEVNDGIRTATTDVIINIVTVTTATLHILESQAHSFDLKGFLSDRGFNFASNAAIFSFLNGNELMDFFISPNGTLSTLGLDREFVAEYHLNINVTDPSSGEMANVLVNIIVEDVNDHGPIFPGDYVFHINETTYVTSTYLGQVEATDFDDPTTRNARLQYSLLVPNRDGFSLTTDGLLYVMGTFDREDRDQYIFVVRAEDFGEPDQEYGYVSVMVNIVDRNDNNPQFFPADVVEFYIEIEISDKEVVSPGSILDGIVAVLPVVNVTLELDHFIFSDPDTSDTLTATLSVVMGTDKYKLESAQNEVAGDVTSYMVVATDYIKPDDHETVLQITLTDEPNEEDPVIRNITILITEVTEPSGTPVTGDTPTTEGVVTTETTNFFTTEIGIAVIVVIVLLGVAMVLVVGCLVFYCIVRYQKSKDPLKGRYVTLTVSACVRI